MHQIILTSGLCGWLLVQSVSNGLMLDESNFDANVQKVHVRLVCNNAPAARASLIGADGKPRVPAGAKLRTTKRNEPYFYADGSFDVELPSGRARMEISGGIETIPQAVAVEAGTTNNVTVEVSRWIDLAARGWYSGDSHVHLHTGGPLDVTVADALRRGPRGGCQLRQSLRVECRWRRHPRRGAASPANRTLSRPIDTSWFSARRCGARFTVTCSSSEYAVWWNRNTRASTEPRTRTIFPRITRWPQTPSAKAAS